MNFYDHLSLIDALTKLCRKVGLYICHCYENSNSERSMTKKDGTPLTQVDLNAHSMLLTGLYSICPDIPVLSEESTDKELENRLDWKRLWLVDPLDGTREFLNKTGEFTINLALVELGRPILGIIYQPLQQVCYAGVVGEGVWRISGGDLISDSLEIENRSATKKTISILSSRGNRGLVFDDYLDWLDRNFIKFNLLKFGAALKFIKLVDGVGDVYPRFSPCSEWDVAAGDAILHAAGGMLVGLDGLPLKYNFRQNLISEPFIAVKDSSNSVQSKSIDFFINYTS